jgi:hypothetical protein
VKTIWGFHTASFRLLFRGLRPRRSEKIAKIFALRDGLRNISEFSHGLERGYPGGRVARSVILSAPAMGPDWRRRIVALDTRFRALSRG